MIVEWSNPHGPPARGEVLSYVVIDGSLHVVVRAGDKVLSKTAAYVRVVEPAPYDPHLPHP